MPRGRERRKARRKEEQYKKHCRGKEPRLPMRNTWGFLDLTPYNAVCLMRGGIERMKL